MRPSHRASWAGPWLVTATVLLASGAVGPTARADDATSAALRRPRPVATATASKSAAPLAPAPIAPPLAPAAQADPPAPPPPPLPLPAKAVDEAPRRRLVIACQEAAIAIESAAMTTQAELRAARAGRDAARAACLDDALSQLHAASRTARSHVDAVVPASRRDDAPQVALERDRLGVVADRAARLRVGAAGCGAAGGARRDAER